MPTHFSNLPALLVSTKLHGTVCLKVRRYSVNETNAFCKRVLKIPQQLANINTQLDREFDRHAAVEAQLNDEKVSLERVILKSHEERDELIKEHRQELKSLESKISQLNEEIESMSKDDVSQKLRIKVIF